MREPQLIVDGRVVAATETSLFADDLGFLQGVGLFETCLVREGRVLFLEEHLARFGQGLASLSFPDRRDEIRVAIAQAVERWGEEDAARLRFTQSAGSAHHPGSLVVSLTALEEIPEEVTLSVSRLRKIASDPLERIKSTSRTRNWLARREATAAGHYDALIRTTEGDFSEGTASNLFTVVAGTVWTPSLERGCLPGVTRDRVIRVMRKLYVPIRKDRVTDEHLATADEVFVTNSSTGVLPVRAVEGWERTFAGREGEIAKRVREGYERDVSRHLMRSGT